MRKKGHLVKFYKYIKGEYIQTTDVDFEKYMTLKEIKAIMRLNHNVLNKSEFFKCITTDKNGILLPEFSGQSNNHYLVVTTS